MTGTQERAVALLREQQSKVKERSPQWMTAEQLMDICRMEPESAERIAQDIEHGGLNITEAEKKIKAFADSHRTGNFACVTPAEADRILREYFGLPEGGGRQEHLVIPFPTPAGESGGIHLDLSSFL